MPRRQSQSNFSKTTDLTGEIPFTVSFDSSRFRDEGLYDLKDLARQLGVDKQILQMIDWPRDVLRVPAPTASTCTLK